MCTPIWRCTECDCSLAEADERRSRIGMRSVSVTSKACTPECVERRRVRLDNVARDPARRARRAALLRRQATLAREAAGPGGELQRFALSLRSLRTAAGLSVRELAARSGIANRYVPMMEAAKLRALPSPGDSRAPRASSRDDRG